MGLQSPQRTSQSRLARLMVDRVGDSLHRTIKTLTICKPLTKGGMSRKIGASGNLPGRFMMILMKLMSN